MVAEVCAQYIGGPGHENLPCTRCGVRFNDHLPAEPRDTVGDWYFIDGINPEPWEAPTAMVGRRGGKAFARLVSSEKQRSFQQAVREAMEEAYGECDMAVVAIKLSFYFWRQKSPNVADVTNLQKALEDALQGILYKNDRQVKQVYSEIVEQEVETEPCILIHVVPALPTDHWVHDLAFTLRTEGEAMRGVGEPLRPAERADADDFF